MPNKKIALATRQEIQAATTAQLTTTAYRILDQLAERGEPQQLALLDLAAYALDPARLDLRRKPWEGLSNPQRSPIRAARLALAAMAEIPWGVVVRKDRAA